MEPKFTFLAWLSSFAAYKMAGWAETRNAVYPSPCTTVEKNTERNVERKRCWKKWLTLLHKLDCQAGTIGAHKGKHAYNHNEHSRAEHRRSHDQQLLNVGQEVLWRNLLQKVLLKNKHVHELAMIEEAVQKLGFPKHQTQKITWTANLFMLKVIHQSGKTETSAFYRFFILENKGREWFALAGHLRVATT